LIYLVSLLAGSFGALLLEPSAPTVGASGAIFGLMGAAAVTLRRRGISLMESGLGLWIGLNLLITFSVPNISIGGHLGGLAGGGTRAVGSRWPRGPLPSTSRGPGREKYAAASTATIRAPSGAMRSRQSIASLAACSAYMPHGIEMTTSGWPAATSSQSTTRD